MDTKTHKIANFDPNGVGSINGQLFGLPFDLEESDIWILPVPWEVTTSFAAGTALGPQAILEASPQLDLYLPHAEELWKKGIALMPIDEETKRLSDQLREKASAYIDHLEQEGHISNAGSQPFKKNLGRINAGSTWLNANVYEQAILALSKGKKIGLLGGDHSTPLGFYRAIAETKGAFGILQIDAHADLRVAYEGFNNSHASIMDNALKIPQVSSLVQVGIRDICHAEVERTKQDPRIHCFTDWDIKKSLLGGKSNWSELCELIIARLPQQVHISFDIDGLNPNLCPDTGTPVPGGFSFSEAIYLLQAVKESGRTVISFDLCEVAPSTECKLKGDFSGDWNANVGARVLYQLCALFD